MPIEHLTIKTGKFNYNDSTITSPLLFSKEKWWNIRNWWKKWMQLRNELLTNKWIKVSIGCSTKEIRKWRNGRSWKEMWKKIEWRNALLNQMWRLLLLRLPWIITSWVDLQFTKGSLSFKSKRKIRCGN